MSIYHLFPRATDLAFDSGSINMALLVFGSVIEWQIITSLSCIHALPPLNTRAGLKSANQQWPLMKYCISSIPLLIQSGISLAARLCGIWSRWAALLRMLMDIAFSSQARTCSVFYGSQPHIERAAERWRSQLQWWHTSSGCPRGSSPSTRSRLFMNVLVKYMKYWKGVYNSILVEI